MADFENTTRIRIRALTKQEKAKDKRLRKLFRITLAEWNKIKEFQESHPIYARLLGGKLGTDHRHKDGKLRGLLEWRLNRAYGIFEKAFPTNTAEVLEALALYHKQHPADLALGKKTFGLIGQAKVKKRMKYGDANSDVDLLAD